MTEYSKNQLYVSKFISNGDGFLFCMDTCLDTHRKGLARVNAGGKAGLDILHVVPAIANGAFACELYFKAIICMESGKKRRIHELVDLHQMLSHNSKQSIREISDFNSAKMKLILKTCNNAFVQARYFDDLKEIEPSSLRKLAYAAQKQTSILFNEKMNTGDFITEEAC